LLKEDKEWVAHGKRKYAQLLCVASNLFADVAFLPHLSKLDTMMLGGFNKQVMSTFTAGLR
jgi:hypothetical protein